MQEKEPVRSSLGIYGGVIRVLAWLVLFASWFGLAAASRSFFRAAQDYGIADTRTFLDAGFGYYGLFSFGLAAVAVLLADKGNIKINLKVFRFFKLTFLASLLFLAPVLLAVMVFLLN